MKCDRCPYAPPVGAEGYQDECGAFEEYGTVWKDGRDGCTLTYSHLKKVANKCAENMDIMGTEMGFEMDMENHGLSIEKAIETAKHMIGIYPEGRRKPYRRHGKTFYKPYRNYFFGQHDCLELMSHDAFGFVEKQTDTIDLHGRHPWYRLTRRGLDWLGRQIGITIRDPEQ